MITKEDVEILEEIREMIIFTRDLNEDSFSVKELDRVIKNVSANVRTTEVNSFCPLIKSKCKEGDCKWWAITTRKAYIPPIPGEGISGHYELQTGYQGCTATVLSYLLNLEFNHGKG